jgi:hypothetical protein
MALGEGSESFHKANLQVFLSTLLSESTTADGLGYFDQGVAESSMDLINKFVLEEGSMSVEDLMFIDDPLFDSGSFSIPDVDSQSEWLDPIEPGGFPNPYF